MLLHAGPAAAQIAATATLVTDYRVRGYSISDGQPALEASISYDDRSGLYANALAVGMLGYEGKSAGLLGGQANLGYAVPLASGPVLDAGVTYTRYTGRYRGGGADYGEVYVGMSTRHISSHIYFSPDYMRRGLRTLYGEIDGAVWPTPKLRLTAHGGVLTRVAGPADPFYAATRYDLRIGAGRRFGPVDLQLSWGTGGPGRDYYGGRARGRSSLVAGLSITF